MPDIDTYLKYRNLFLRLGKTIEVHQLDIHYKLNFLYDQEGNLIKILKNN